MTISQQPALALERLGEEISGRIVRPYDSAYDEARRVYAPDVDRRPLAVVYPADAEEVAAVVSFARESGSELAVRSGGHGVAGHGTSEGGIVLDLSGMKALEIEPETREAFAETGLTAGEVTAASGRHGLAVGFGDTGTVGIGGLTLGGGIGYLVRKHGLTIDHLLGAEIVTADGSILHADAERHADLFWAIRGGGGNFGVATRFRYRLHPVATVTGGMLVLPGTPETIAQLVAEAGAASDDLSVIANVVLAPPLPFIPADRVGRPVLLGLIAHSGALADGERAVARIRAIAPPIADMVRPQAYPQLFPPPDPSGPHIGAIHSLFLDEIDTAVATEILDRLHASSAAMPAAQIRVLGGALARVPVEATAFAHRRRRIMLTFGAAYRSPDEGPLHQAWSDESAAALRQGEEAAYVNFLGQADTARARAAYPAPTWERLAEVKRRYDPANLFRVNHNVPPA